MLSTLLHLTHAYCRDLFSPPKRLCCWLELSFEHIAAERLSLCELLRGEAAPHWVPRTDARCQTVHLAARLILIPALPRCPRSSCLSLKTTSDKHLISKLNIAIFLSPRMMPVHPPTSLIPQKGTAEPLFPPLFSSLSRREAFISVAGCLSPGINLAEI